MELQKLSDVQRKAVTTTEGAVLVLAGAGSGKTSELTNRVAYLIEEKHVDPYRILAITFTNKAAGEMKERIGRLLNADVSDMMISTFHSMCAKFLRFDAKKLGYENNYSIYDTDECKTIIKGALSQLNIDAKWMPPGKCLSYISAAKNAVGKMSPEDYFDTHFDAMKEDIKAIYKIYTARLKAENAMDFDDLLLNMLKLLETDEQARRWYTGRYDYILVDEYQDTNSVQYAIVKILAEKCGNLFVVGDDDQSIYGWRGADIRNILDFERDYPGTIVIKLEQNYRSHAKILDAANAVISKATERKDKKLWSVRTEGPKPRLFTAGNEYAEAEFIAREIGRLAGENKPYSDMAILYRTHTQTRVLEEKLRTFGIPYRVYGGTSFYERKEIRDMIAYLTILDNPSADTSLLRIINEPRRGIGDVSLGKVRQFADEQGMSYLDALAMADQYASGATAAKLKGFYGEYREMAEAIEGLPPDQALDQVFTLSGYRAMLQGRDEADAQARIENVEELINGAAKFAQDNEEAGLTEFLSSISLITDMDTVAETGSVTLMTLHSAKGLEFSVVFMAGMEESIFPSWRSIEENKIDEERRLCYVGITRAKDLLYLTNCESRHMYAGANMNKRSRFLEDIPADCVDVVGRERPQYQRSRAPQRDYSVKPVVEFKPKANEDSASFQVGMLVEHKKFGRGPIKSIVGEGEKRIALVGFPDGDRKMFLAFAPLKIVG